MSLKLVRKSSIKTLQNQVPTYQQSHYLSHCSNNMKDIKSWERKTLHTCPRLHWFLWLPESPTALNCCSPAEKPKPVLILEPDMNFITCLWICWAPGWNFHLRCCCSHVDDTPDFKSPVGFGSSFCDHFHWGSWVQRLSMAPKSSGDKTGSATHQVSFQHPFSHSLPAAQCC